MLDKFKHLTQTIKSKASSKEPQDQYLVGLDIGTEFIKALIAKVNDNNTLEIIGVGRAHQELTDMQAGAISDIAAVVSNCDKALNQAEQQAGISARVAVLGIAGELVKGTTTTIRCTRTDPEKPLDINEIEQIINLVQDRAETKARQQLAWEMGGKSVEIRLVNSALVNIDIDGYLVTNPVGFQGKEVVVQLYTAFAPLIHIGALERTAQELDLDLLAVAAEPFAVARSVIGDDPNANISAVLMDIGGGTTDIAVINEGGMQGTKMFGIGGRAFTKAIERETEVNFAQAEKLKLDFSEDKLTKKELVAVKTGLDKTVKVWEGGVELALAEFDKLDHLPNLMLLCGGGSSLNLLMDELGQTDWYKELPFTRKPKVQRIHPEQVVGITDKTGLVNDHTYITAMGLLRVGMDTLSQEGSKASAGTVRQRLDKDAQNMKKDVVYVDVDEEITGVIDKVASSKEKIVALVLPKRASIFQSIVNLRLLKRSADENQKNLVLITSEASLMPLAGAVGLRVAKTLQSKPVVPNPPELSDDLIKVEEEESDKEVDKNKPVGVLAGLAPRPIPVSKPDEDEAIELDNSSKMDNLSAAAGGLAKTTKDKAKKLKDKGKKIKVPNFEKFRLLLILGAVGLIVLIVAFIFASNVLPKVTVTIKTNTSGINSSQTVTLNSAAQSLDPVNLVVPSKIEQVQKTVTSSQVTTTGQKTVGTAASGTITITNDCYNSVSQDVPDGTVFTDSSGNFNFTSTADETIPGSSTSVSKGHVQCSTPTVSVPVTAVQVGASYNIAATGYTSQDSDLQGYQMQGSAMTGGASQQEQTVAQADITNAEGQVTAPNTTSIEQQIEQSLKQAGYTPIVSTFVSNPPNYSPSADVDGQANTVTVTGTFVYTMYGAKQSDLTTLIDNNVNQQINTSNQEILDSGVSGASFSVITTTSTTAQLTMQATSTVGPKFNVPALKKEIAGQKSGDIQSIINNQTGVTSVKIHYWPFWVSTAPSKLNKISIVIEKADGSKP